MPEELIVSSATREGRYKELFPQLESLVAGEPDLVANMANICAAIKQTFGFLWVGFYLVKGDELVLGPFQGPVACTRIKKGKGVCGSSWLQAKTIIVDDVDKFPGHIACSSLSRSEIVVPLLNNEGAVFGVLDVDSGEIADFSGTDRTHLEKIVSLINQ